MFDPPTVALITSAPPLEGLDQATLSKELTRAYSTIVSLRMRLRGLSERVDAPDELKEILTLLERLGYAQEAFAALAPERPNRASAAFVAATAHQLRFTARRLQQPSEQITQVSAAAIGPELAATIMFLVADRVADAAQMSRSIVFDESPTVENQLRLSIAQLAQGNLANIRSSTWLPEETAETDRDREVIDLLWWRLLQGLRTLAADLLGEDAGPVLEGASASIFAEIRDLSIQAVDFGGGSQVLSVFPGPHHMASLLYNADGVLRRSAIVGLRNPPEVDSASWSKFLASVAVRRPYLWPNHQEAIKAGYLNTGVSAVVSFPTGAGKSTLTELKIAVAKQQGRKVIYLAPTLALVSQVASDLRKTFPDARSTSADEVTELDLSPVSVMTPERCLSLLGFNPAGFSEVGLLVFDECHIIHPQKDSSRRSIDAMLCLLGFLTASPSADVLLVSAMIKNAAELADWIKSLLGREVLALPSNWKPTRQARGCVVYDGKEIEKLKHLILVDAASKTTKSISQGVRRKLLAKPIGMFSLNQAWTTTELADYALLPLLDEEVALDAAKYSQSWAYLTSNRNVVAADLASAAGDQGVKTLVFAQTIPFCSSIQKSVSKKMQSPKVKLNADELRHRELAIIELGDEVCTYCELEGCVASHHGLLLPMERFVNESLFRRSDGINVLVATSTLAQGMNLPSQLVVIAGDDKYDPELEKTKLLEAHNLLNAAGRAGRAGEAAEGMVILIPGQVVEFHSEKNSITGRWFELQGIFSNSDQCLELEDPIESLLDHIHAAAASSDLSDYLVRRLPIKIGQGEELARVLLERSFGAYRHRQAGENEWIQQRVEAALTRRQRLIAEPGSFGWEEELASTTGTLSPICIRAIATALEESSPTLSAGAQAWIEWGMKWLVGSPTTITDIVRPTTITGVFGSAFEGVEADEAKQKSVLQLIQLALPLWIEGRPLREIESVLKPQKPSTKCDTAREWAIRLAPELAYFFSLIPQIYTRIMEVRGEEVGILPLGFTMHGRCVREGFDLVEKLASFQAENGQIPRVAIHRKWSDGTMNHIRSSEFESFSDLVRSVRTAISM
jgi:superfamily II DNA/RNA helicase